jgi:hypothetical protein
MTVLPSLIACNWSNVCFRTIVREHIPKRCGNLEEPISTTKKFDNTVSRIYGETVSEASFSTEYGHIGAGKNAADQIAKVGKKTQLAEAEVS